MSTEKYYSNLNKVNSKDVYDQLAEFTRIARYSQYNPDEKRRETWEEQVERVFKMHKVKYMNHLDNTEFLEAYTLAKNMMLKKRILGSQRALQFGGPTILNKNTRIYNCSATYIDRVRVFQEVMFSLLCGVGMGFSVQKHHIKKLPLIKKPKKNEVEKFTIPDSIEGWSDSVGVLLSSYFTNNNTFPEYYGKNVEFDYTKIRPKGSPISNMNGKAPGPDGLKNSLEKIRSLLESRFINENTDKNVNLRPIDAYDIIMHLSDAVLSGGVRRSATLCLFSLEDEEMIKAKTGDWYIKNPQRGRSNNSALLLRNKTPKEKYMNLINSVKQFGEPGLIWSDSTECLFNPCVEVGLWIPIL
jgi:ribonucleoside-diphosphate reductase alpha chain